MRILVKFIRTGNISNGSHSTRMVMPIQSRLYEAGDAEPLRVDLHLMGSTLRVSDPPSCRMRTQEVNMGTLSPASFSGVGSHAGQRSYDLVLDCEAGVGQVDYQVVPTTAVINSELGLAEASGGVAGVAYQFLNADGSPLRFYATDLFGHGGATEQVLTKTFGVRFQQTLPTIPPGPANAGLMRISRDDAHFSAGVVRRVAVVLPGGAGGSDGGGHAGGVPGRRARDQRHPEERGATRIAGTGVGVRWRC
ncbi:hypothetical protein G6F22_016768 [Rhizopus arrhizus]|nr:hypothetical protein G6F22_016768 [Rhizopus arrhizus]